MRRQLLLLAINHGLSGRELKNVIKRYRIKKEQMKNLFYVEQKIEQYKLSIN